MSQVRILIADDHPIFRDGLRRLIEAEDDFAVVGEATNAEDAIDLTRRLQPDVLLLDVAMPKMSGLGALEQLADVLASTRVILLTAGVERADMVRALQLGARGIVLKESATSLLLNAIRIVTAGGFWVGRDSVGDLVSALDSLGQPDRNAEFGLTPRELEIVGLIAAAAGNKKIADVLNISEKTVKQHLTSIFGKLGVSSRLELAMFATKHNLVPRV